MNNRYITTGIVTILSITFIRYLYWHTIIGEFFTALTVGIGINMILLGLGFFKWLEGNKKTKSSLPVKISIQEKSKRR